MRKVNDIIKTTNNRFLNMYELDMVDENGKHGKYFVSSRAEKIEDLKIVTKENKADGVISGPMVWALRGGEGSGECLVGITWGSWVPARLYLQNSSHRSPSSLVFFTPLCSLGTQIFTK